jgi:hypothetical protein
MSDKHDVRRIALGLPGMAENGEDSFDFQRDGRGIAWPYLERVDPKKPRVKRFDRFVIRVADADDKEAYLQGEPDLFFTTDHYTGYAAVIVRLGEIDEARLEELLQEAWAAAPLSSRLKRAV